MTTPLLLKIRIEITTIIDTRETETVATVKEGETVIIAGLMQDNVQENISKFPLLGDIPYLGRLFRSTTITDVVTEIVFVLTPHMANTGDVQTLDELGFNSIIDKTDIDKLVVKKTDTKKKYRKPYKKKIDMSDDVNEHDTIPYNRGYN